MKLVLILVGCLIIIVVAIVIIGYALPVKHQAVKEVHLKSSAEQTWQTVTDFATTPTWLPSLKSTEMVIGNNETLWKEIDADGSSITYRTIESHAPVKLVRQIADKGLPFGGTWTFDFIGDKGGTTLRITEDGEVYNPVFRFMSRFVFGHTATLERYLNALKIKLGERP